MAVLCDAAWYSANCGDHARRRRDVVVATMISCSGGQSGRASRFLSCAAFGKPAWLPTALSKPTHEKDTKDEDHDDGRQHDTQPKQQTVRVHDDLGATAMRRKVARLYTLPVHYPQRARLRQAKQSKNLSKVSSIWSSEWSARCAVLNWGSLQRAVGARGATLRCAPGLLCWRPIETSYWASSVFNALLALRKRCFSFKGDT